MTELDMGEHLETITTVQATPNNPFINKPSRYLVPKTIVINTSVGRQVLTYRTNEYLTHYWPDRTSVGLTKYYSNLGVDKFIIAPCVTVTSDIEITSINRPVYLSTDNQTNILTSIAPEALFYGTMKEASLFLKMWDSAQLWEGEYQRSMLGLNNQGRRQRQDDQEGATNDIGENTLNRSP
jgi:hypothetical protein